MVYCALFLSLLQSINEAQLLNNSSLLLLFGFAAGDGAGATDIVLLTCIYTSPKCHKHHFSIEVLNLIWILVLYVPYESFFGSKFRFLILCIV